MREAVVVASSRTALAKSFRGSFNLTRPEDLAAHCIKDVLDKTPKLAAKEIEDVVLGCAQPHGAQGQNIARISAMLAGLPASVAGTTINRFALPVCKLSRWRPTRLSMRGLMLPLAAAWRASR